MKEGVRERRGICMPSPGKHPVGAHARECVSASSGLF